MVVGRHNVYGVRRGDQSMHRLPAEFAIDVDQQSGKGWFLPGGIELTEMPHRITGEKHWS